MQRVSRTTGDVSAGLICICVGGEKTKEASNKDFVFRFGLIVLLLFTISFITEEGKNHELKSVICHST